MKTAAQPDRIGSANQRCPTTGHLAGSAGACAAEAGFTLVAVVVMAALVLIALSVAAPIIAKDIRRDKEVESEHRAEQYVRGIRLYYRKLHSYPGSMDALKQTNNVRFLRKEYVDPLTGKPDWRVIHLGEQKTTVKGFFGQELGGLATSGAGSSMGTSSLGSPIGSSVGGTSSTSTIGSTSALAAGFGGASVTTTTGATGANGSTGASGSTGSTGGMGVIIGVGPARSGESILTPNGQKTYESWEFWYDPRIEQLYQKGQMNGAGSTGLGSQSATSFGSMGASGSTGATGSSFGGSSFGNPNSGGGGTTPTTPPQ